MQLSGLFADDDAVSPVIGVILMVAITVILAAVIASFVLGLGSQPEQTPQTQFEFDYNGSVLEISHNGGESITAQEIELRGTAVNGSDDVNDPAGWHENSDALAESSVTTGDTAFLGTYGGGTGDWIDANYDVTVTYVPSEGGNTAPLADDQGPDA